MLLGILIGAAAMGFIFLVVAVWYLVQMGKSWP